MVSECSFIKAYFDIYKVIPMYVLNAGLVKLIDVKTSHIAHYF